MPYTDTTPRIYFETSGDPADQPLVLIEGMTAQLVGWRDGFVDALVKRGLFVIRLDNRDVGLSDKMGGPEDLGLAYSLDDMAGDVCRVLDTLGIASAHIVGQSMGGGIAQSMAIHHPDRVRSLVLFYTAPAFSMDFVTDELAQSLATAPPFVPVPREQALAVFVENQRLCGSVGYGFDEEWYRELAALSYDRCYRPDGLARQVMAVSTSSDRTEQLAQVTVPTTIIHGDDDHLVKVEASLALARAIRGSELHIYAGMGHHPVEPLWDEFANIIARTAARA